jgi:hypothetical protein
MYRTLNLCFIFLHGFLRNIFQSDEYLTSNDRDTCRTKPRHSIHKTELSPDFNKKWNIPVSGGRGKYGGEERCTQGIVGNPAGKRKLGRPRHR